MLCLGSYDATWTKLGAVVKGLLDGYSNRTRPKTEAIINND